MAVTYELPAIAGVYLLIGLLAVIGFTFTLLAHAFNVSVFGTHPFASLAHAIESTIVAGCNDGIAHLEHFAVRLEADLVDALRILIDIMLLPQIIMRAMFGYLWHSLVKPLVADVGTTIHGASSQALTLAKVTAAQLSADVRTLEAKIGSSASAVYQTVTRETRVAIRDAGIETWRGIDEVQRNLRQEFETALQGIEGATGTVVGTLDAATEATIRAIEEAQQSTTDELNTLLRNLNPADIAGLLAAVPVVTALVQAIATESGLDNAVCRAKVRGICGTNPLAWEAMLAGLLPLVGVFTFRQLVEEARTLMGGLAGTIREIA